MERLRKALIRTARRFLHRGGTAYLERFDTDRITGWAVDPAAPGSPAQLSLVVDGQVVLNIIADMPREDVAAAGMGPLRCGFDIAMPRAVRDGRAHRIELRRGTAGPVLRGGLLVLPESGSAPAASLPEGLPAEGVAFAEGDAIAGWATGCTGVRIDIDGGRGAGGLSVEVAPDRTVPGLGESLRAGFRLTLPAALRDGAPHQVQVTALPGGTPLDGCPFTIRAGAARPSVRLVAAAGDRFVLQLRDGDGHPVDAPVTCLADGTPLIPAPADPAAPGRIALHLPAGTRHLVVTDAAGPVARFVAGPGLPETRLPPAERDWPADLDAQASAAFAAFCAAPGRAFDAGWYAVMHGLGPAEDALAHYRDGGAAAGLSPGPRFDEAAARALHPDLAARVAEGRLPCLLAVELVLGEGALGTLTGLAPELALAITGTQGADGQGTDGRAAADRWAARQGAGRGSGAAPVPAALPAVPVLPAPTGPERAGTSIWSAWVARLDTDPQTLAAIAADEAAMRAGIRSRPLLSRPKVSIVMPTWNRAFTIGEAIQSVLDQSYDNWELLVCDDASEDRTADVVRGFDDPRIRYMTFLKSNGAGARNKGLRFATGDFIAYLDSDNIWHPLFLDMMLRRLLAAPGREMAYCAYLDTEIAGARVRLDRIARQPFRAVQLSGRNFIDLNTILHHRRLADWMGSFDNALPRLQDWDLVLRYTAVFDPVHVDRIGVFYRRNVAWGQVTHLFLGNSDAQAIVGAKTRARREGRIDRLEIPWPARPRLAILAAPGALAEGRALARLAAGIGPGLAEVTLFEPADAAEGAPLPAGVLRHGLPAPLWRDPARLAAALPELGDGRAVIGAGCTAGWLAALGGVAPGRILQLEAGPAGPQLAAIASPGARYRLGGLALGLGPAPAARAGVLLLAGDLDPAAQEAARTAALRAGLTILVPPQGAAEAWQSIGPEGRQTLVPGPQADLPAAVAAAAIAVVPGAVADLPAGEQALLLALMGQGMAVAVAPDPADPAALAGQWIEAKAAYEIRRRDPAWIFEKVPKVLADGANLARLSERAALVHAIAHQPAAATERLAHALWRTLCAPPAQEVLDDAP